MLALLVVAGCASGDGTSTVAEGETISIDFEVVEARTVFRFSGIARVAPADGAGGLWASVPGLSQAETGRLRRGVDAGEDARAGNGAPTDGTEPGSAPRGRGLTVALFRGGPAAVISSEAGAALGLAPGEAAEVEIVALRREPRLIAP